MTNEPQQQEPSEEFLAVQKWVNVQMSAGWPRAGDVFLFANAETRIVTAASSIGGPYTVAGPIIRKLTLEEKTKMPPIRDVLGQLAPPPDEAIIDSLNCDEFPAPVGTMGEPVALARGGAIVWYHPEAEVEPPPAQGDA